MIDVIPIVVVVLGFQFLVIRRRPSHPKAIAVGFIYVVVGLTLFLVGLEEALFPLGEAMAAQLTAPEFLGATPSLDAIDWSAYFWVYVFAAAIGFATTIAEPSLIAVALKANEVSGGTIGVWGLRTAVAVGVAIGVGLGTFRIVAGYIIVVLQTVWAERAIIPLAYDTGGVTTSTVTVPLVTALGLGLATGIPGRSPLIDGFGLIAFASLFPMITVMGYAQASAWQRRRRRARRRRS